MADAQTLPPATALVVVDVQEGFDDPWWGRRDNPAADANIEALVDAFAASGRPLVYVRHESANPDSPLHPDQPGNRLKPYLARHAPALTVTKSVNSSFHGEPDLHAWLQGAGVTSVVVAGITTNHCCETTARVAGNLGYDTWFALDATHTFDRAAPDGTVMTAEELARATATNLHGEFATVAPTRQLLEMLGEPGAAGAP
ncbi:cysteine hydrolase family protein [Nocardioides sp. GCM10027113]|uniref:cysteine hydrolase family protein n=1 Tax=unclassified Nocardioides TaxID=2615069 RepID=UPI00361C7821